MSHYRFLASMIMGTTISVGAAFADMSIPVVNQSFETIATGLPIGCGVGCSYSIAPIQGWTISGFTGQFQPGYQAGNQSYLNGPSSDGTPTVAYSSGGVISQTLSSVVQVGAVYSMTVSIAHRNDVPQLGTADLLINGNIYNALGLPAAAGEWSVYTATYTGLPVDAGKPITIELNASGTQGNFDKVDVTATPEPALLGALTMGVAGLAVAAVNRRRRA